jgi:NhaP-type Na+/H+ or K+/H+ antiporter
MALSLPAGPYRNIVLDMTYLTVAFSVLFQGTTFGYVVKKTLRRTV